MTYAVLVSLAQTIDQILNYDQCFISLHQKQQITSIHEHAIFLQAFLEDFPEKANNIERRIRDVANQAENIIEYFMWGQIGPNVGPEKVQLEDHHERSKYTHLCYDFNELEKLTGDIELIAGEVMDIMNRFRIKEVRLDSPAASSSTRRYSAPTHKKDAILVGLNDDLLAIKERLCGGSPKRQVIPIVGMGGIGKTTLAKNVYNDSLTIHHFYIRSWITISQDYNAQDILSSLLVSINPERSEQGNDSVADHVYRSLKGKRYLIVLDDLWSTKVWDDLNMIFPNDNNGSRIILTTRLSDVAAYPHSSSHLHEMHLMGTDQSWDLLRQKVFKQELCTPELENIGKEISRNCKGLPLAIVVVAGLLSTVRKTPASWKEIAENVNSAIATKHGQFEKILSLSYTHLPHHLRPCFLYMGAFPEDYEILVSELIKLWVAEGFLQPSESKTLEEMAVEYLEDLVKRSLVLVSKRKSNGKIKSCSLHDLMRELCIRKAEEEKFLLHVINTSVPKKNIKNQLRICIEQSDLNCLANINRSTIRSLICFARSKSSTMYLEYYRVLRVLVVVRIYEFAGYPSTVPLPAQVFQLFRLRHLAFTDPVEIPAGISNLQSLQTLIIHPRRTMWDLSCMANLPSEVWRMRQLRHLVCFNFGELPNPEEGATSPLENLQTLSAVTDLICTKRILRMIPNVKKLGIFYSGDKDEEDYHLENIVHLQQLEKLKLSQNPYCWKEVNLAFPWTLKKLTLSGWHIPWEYMRVVGSLPNLEVLKLRDFACHGDKWETNDGEFPQLKFLLIKESYLQCWITESSHFPNLKCLLLHDCLNLREIPDGIGEISTLELIEVKSGWESLAESAKIIQEKQQSYGNDALQVRCLHFNQISEFITGDEVDGTFGVEIGESF